MQLGKSRGDNVGRLLSNQDIEQFFIGAEPRIVGNPSLREPQVEGHSAASSYFAGGGHRAVEQIPVGCGKTGLIAILPFGIARGRVLVIAPNLTIRDQIAEAVDATNPNSFYRRAGVLSDLSAGPYRSVLDADANIHDADAAHIVVTNIHQLADNNERWLPNFADDYFDLILVDEGHHNVAPTWQSDFERFPRARVVSLTATPFRADEVPIEGDVVYRYTFRRAMERGYIKQMTARNVAPRELRFTLQGEEHSHTLDEVLAMREEDWYSRGVALAEESNVSIVDASIQHLNYLREATGLGHQLIAVACSMDHARQIRGLYEARGLVAREIHSAQKVEDREEILRSLRNGTLDAIIQVQMLGEGFDHPQLSVAAIFRPFRSLSPYIQFVGRAMRVNVQRAPGHPDNEGIIVSHVGLNIDRHWNDFKEIDGEDREVVDDWLGAGDEPPPAGEGGGRRRLRPDMVVTEEFVDRFLSDTYLDASEDALIDNALAVARDQGLDLEALGITRDVLQKRLAEQKKRVAPNEPERLPVQPQAQRRMLRDRLREQAQSAANRILEALGESPSGRRIAALGGDAGGAHNNLGAVIKMMHSAVNEHLGIDSNERRDQSIEALERGIASIDAIADEVESNIRERLDGRTS
jgi:superfamily II DNA or RNA helicase